VASPASTSPRSHDQGADQGAGNHSPPVLAGEAIAIIQRDDFLLELGEALGGQVSIQPVETLAAALEQATGSRRPRILLIDSRDVADLRADVDQAHTQAPHVPIVVFAPADEEKIIAGVLKSSNVFAVLPIPVDPRKTGAILEGALAEALAKRGSPHTPEKPMDPRAGTRTSTPAERRPVPAASAAPPEEQAPSKKGLIAAIAAVVIAAGAAAGFYVLRRAPLAGAAKPTTSASSSAAVAHASPVSRATAVSPVPAPAAAPATAPAPLVEGTVDSLLEKARLAMRERRYLSPANDSALLYYLSALKADPTNGEARDGLARLAGLAMSRFDAAMTARHYDAAAAALANLKLAAPHEPRLGALTAELLEGQITSAFAASDFTHAAALIRQAGQSNAASAAQLAKWRAALAKGQSAARISHLASVLEGAVRAGHLRSPSDDNAQSDLQQLEALAPGSPAAEHGAEELISAYLSRARQAALTGTSSDADKWVAAARGAGMTDAQLSAYQHSVADARAQAAASEADRLAGLARARIQSGQLITPAKDSADYYLTRLESARGEQSVVHSIRLELASSLITDATTAARAGKLAAMRADLAAARRWGADPVLVAAVEQIVNGPPKAAAPANDGSRIPRGYTPQRVRYVAPEYPQAALDAHESGAVTVEFVVDFNGVPRDVHVVQSQPRGVFDYAAVTAVARWRFAPPIIDNVPTEVPTRTVIRFVAPN
jgi:periplasmic protein TonB